MWCFLNCRSAQSVPSLVPGTPTTVPTDDFQSTMKEVGVVCWGRRGLKSNPSPMLGLKVELQREQLASYHKQKLEVEKSHSREEVVRSMCHTPTHAHTHTCTPPHMHTPTHAHTHTCTHYTLSSPHAHTHNTHVYTYTLSHTPKRK